MHRPASRLVRCATGASHACRRGRLESQPNGAYRAGCFVRAPQGPLVQWLGVQRYVLLAGGLAFVVLPHPILPLLARGAVLAAELEPGYLGVAQTALLGGRGRE